MGRRPDIVQEKVTDRHRYGEQLLSSRREPNTPLPVDAFLQYIPPDAGPIEIEIHALRSASDAAGFIEQYIKSRRPADWVHVVEGPFSDSVLLRAVDDTSPDGPITGAGSTATKRMEKNLPFIILFLIAGVFIVLGLLFAHLKHKKRRQIIVKAFSDHLASQ
jgi:hypothetical protein